MAIATFKSLFWPQQRPLLLGFSTVDPWFKVALRRKGGLRNRGVGGSLADGVTWLMVGSQVHVCNRPICGGGRLMLLVALCLLDFRTFKPFLAPLFRGISGPFFSPFFGTFFVKLFLLFLLLFCAPFLEIKFATSFGF
jgi:formate-dependent nitrite reductase membrane component NrfD